MFFFEPMTFRAYNCHCNRFNFSFCLSLGPFLHIEREEIIIGNESERSGSVHSWALHTYRFPAHERHLREPPLASSSNYYSTKMLEAAQDEREGEKRTEILMENHVLIPDIL